jgi:hypothetical protein
LHDEGLAPGKETDMADDPNKQDNRDRSRVAGGEDYEVRCRRGNQRFRDVLRSAIRPTAMRSCSTSPQLTIVASAAIAACAASLSMPAEPACPGRSTRTMMPPAAPLTS